MAKPAPRMGRPAAVPSLVFADLDEAVGYYRDIFGSDARWDHDGGTEAFVHVHGATIRLRQALPGELDGLPTGCTNDLEDVLVLVDRPYQLYRHLDDRGADGLDGAEPGAGGVFRIVDPAGHVLGLAPTRGVLPAVRRLAWPPAADRLQIALRHRRTAREEAPQLRKLAEFYRALPNKRDIFYMFFSSGLLNWVAKSTSYLPDDLNLVLIGSDLPADEQQWVRDHLRWPFVHLDLRIDDNTAWDFLYEVNEHSFGWLDTDCLVLNDGLFGELAEIADTDVVNAVWWHDTGSGFPLGNTYFMFVNIAAVRAVRDAGLGAKGGMYSYHAFNRHVPGRAFRRDLRPGPASPSGRRRPRFAGCPANRPNPPARVIRCARNRAPPLARPRLRPPHVTPRGRRQGHRGILMARQPRATPRGRARSSGPPREDGP